MPALNKSKSGMLLYEDFSQNSLIWNPSPNDYTFIEFGGFGLKIKHSDIYRMITVAEPTSDYTMICKISHIPVNEQDIGGVIVVGDAENYVECQSCIMKGPSTITNSAHTEEEIKKYVNEVIDNYVQYEIDNGTIETDSDDNTKEDTDDNTKEDTEENSETETPDDPTQEEFVDVMYPYIKVIKYCGVYTFLASKNGVQWEEIGNAALGSGRIGFFLYGDEKNTISEDLSHFVIEYTIFYDNNYISIENMPTNQKFDIFSNDTRICSSDSAFVTRGTNRIVIDTTALNIPIKDATVRVYQDDIGTDYFIGDIIGGDILTMTFNVGLFLEGNEILPSELYDLGTFYNYNQTMKLDLYNYEEYTLKNIKVIVIAYSIYYGGEENILISLYDEAQQNYNFKKEIIIDSIASTESKSFLIKLNSKIMQDFYKTASSYRFKINIIES